MITADKHRQQSAATGYNYKRRKKNQNKNRKKRVLPWAIYSNKLLQLWKLVSAITKSIWNWSRKLALIYLDFFQPFFLTSFIKMLHLNVSELRSNRSRGIDFLCGTGACQTRLRISASDGGRALQSLTFA